MSTDVYDVAIVGAGPAGATAAVLLANRERRVVLIDRDTFPRSVPCAGWLNVRSIPLLEELGAKVKGLLKQPFDDVTFHKADFSQTAKPTFATPPGYLIDRSKFDNALVDTAIRAGATVLQGCEVQDLKLKESSASVLLADGKALEARLLLIASGRDSELLDRAGVHVGTEGSPIWSAQLDGALGKSPARKPRIDVVLGLDKLGSFGFFCTSKGRLSIGVNWMGDRDDARPALAHLAAQAFAHEVVPVDLSAQAPEARLLRSPTSVALDMESHVGKHTLVIGDAGGFVSAASNEGIYPAMWSARIAVEVIEKALQSPHSQDELMAFDSAWRMQMADYLRSPHTDIQFLLPLVFTNQPMADRMAAAFFAGENI